MLGGLMNATGLCCDEQRHVSNQPMFLIHQKSALDDPLPTTKNTHSHEIHLQTSPQVPPQTTNKNDGTVTPPKEPDNEATRQRDDPHSAGGTFPLLWLLLHFLLTESRALLVSGVAYFLFVRDYIKQIDLKTLNLQHRSGDHQCLSKPGGVGEYHGDPHADNIKWFSKFLFLIFLRLILEIG